ncbi:MAG: glycosyltransferase family 4 protein [Thermoanaerobaculia bacterium]
MGLKQLLGPIVDPVRGRLWRLHPRRVAALARWSLGVVRTIRRRRRDPRLTVAVDVSPLWEPLTGIGWYLYRLLEHLAPRSDLVLRLYGPTLAADEAVGPPAVPLPEGPALEPVLYPVPEDAAIHPDRLIRLLRRLDRWLVAADGNRVLFAPNYLPSGRFDAATGALVATVHDLAYRVVPWAVRRETREWLETELDRVWLRAARIVTVSRAVAGEITARGLADPSRLRVIPNGPGASRGGGAPQEPDPRQGTLPDSPEGFVLSVGTLEPRKNLETLLEAWSRLHRRRGDAPPLVLAGKLGWSADTLRRRVEEAAHAGWLLHLGYVDEATLAALYRRTRLFVFPSHYEGFGLPVLEAMAAGVPVVASDLPVLREVAGDAVLYAPPLDPEAWTLRIEGLLDDPERTRRLAAAGRARAERFTWERTAEAYTAVFREASGRAHRTS